MTKVTELRPANDLLGMEEDLFAVKALANAISLITVAPQDAIQRNAADTLFQIARQIGVHADALKAQWEAALKETKGAA
jgi:hypothetical protein